MLNNFLMNPNWSSGARVGNKDRVQYIRPSAIGQRVDKKTPKDAFNPPSAPYNPKLKKQKYLPSDIYKKDSSMQNNPAPLYPDPVPNPIAPAPQPTSDENPPPPPPPPPPELMAETDDEKFNDIMSTIDSARSSVKSSVNEPSSSGINYRNLLIQNTRQGLVEPSGAGTVVVGSSRSNVESQLPTNEGLNGINIPGAWYTSNPDADITSTAYSDQSALENRLIDTDTRAVNRRYVPQPLDRNITAQEMTENPLRPNVPVARFSDTTSVIMRDSQGSVVLNDNPDNISTADVLEARNRIIGNLTVEVDAAPPQPVGGLPNYTNEPPSYEILEQEYLIEVANRARASELHRLTFWENIPSELATMYRSAVNNFEREHFSEFTQRRRAAFRSNYNENEIATALMEAVANEAAKEFYETASSLQSRSSTSSYETVESVSSTLAVLLREALDEMQETAPSLIDTVTTVIQTLENSSDDSSLALETAGTLADLFEEASSDTENRRPLRNAAKLSRLATRAMLAESLSSSSSSRSSITSAHSAQRLDIQQAENLLSSSRTLRPRNNEGRVVQPIQNNRRRRSSSSSSEEQFRYNLRSRRR